jgi:hypothetical protein
VRVVPEGAGGPEPRGHRPFRSSLERSTETVVVDLLEPEHRPLRRVEGVDPRFGKSDLDRLGCKGEGGLSLHDRSGLDGLELDGSDGWLDRGGRESLGDEDRASVGRNIWLRAGKDRKERRDQRVSHKCSSMRRKRQGRRPMMMYLRWKSLTTQKKRKTRSRRRRRTRARGRARARGRGRRRANI